MKKRFKIPIIITIIALVLSCFTIPAFATPSATLPSDTLLEPIFYPTITSFNLRDAEYSERAFNASFDTSYYNTVNGGDDTSSVLSAHMFGFPLTCSFGVESVIFYNETLDSNIYYASNSIMVNEDQFPLTHITYYFDDIGVESDLYDNINYLNLYNFISSYEDQDRNNLLQGFTVYFTYKSYDYLLDDFHITNYQQRFSPISNDYTAFVSAMLGVDSSMLYVNPLELVKQEASDNGLSLFGILTDIRIEVTLSSSVNPQISSFANVGNIDFGSNHYTDVRDRLYIQYGEDNSPSAEAPADIFGWIVDCADALFQFEIMPGLTISVIFVGILGILVFIYIMKRFAGG